MNVAVVESVLVWAAEIAVLHVVFTWLDRRRPPRPSVDLSHLTAEERARIARGANRFGTIAYIVAWPLLTVAWLVLFQAIRQASRPVVPGAAFVMEPTFLVAVPGPLIAGMVLCGPAGLAAMRLRYWGRYREVMAAGDAHYRLDIRRLMYVVFVWVVPLLVDWETLWIGRFVAFTPDAVVARGVWSRAPEVRPYRDLAAIYAVDATKTVRNQVMPDRRFVLVFEDGSEAPSPRWAYHGGPQTLDEPRHVARRSGMPIQWVRELP